MRCSVVLGGFLCHAIAFGAMYSFGVFFEEMANDFGGGLGGAAWIGSLSGTGLVVFSGIAGRLAARFGARPIVMGGALLTALSMVLASGTSSTLEASLTLGLLLGLAGSLSYAPVHAAVAQWFPGRFGFALGITLAGSGVGAAVMAPLGAALVEDHGWRVGLRVLAIGGLVLHATGAALVRDRRSTVVEVAKAPPLVWRDRFFRRLYVATFVGTFAYMIPYLYLVPYARDQGLSLREAGTLLGLLSIGNTVGRVALASLGDRIGAGGALRLSVAGCAGALAAWPWLGAGWALALFALAFGLFSGGWVAVLPGLLADRYDRRWLGAIAGSLYTSMTVGSFVGPPLVGTIVDRLDSYTVAIALCAAAMAVNLLSLGRLGPTQRWNGGT